MASVKGTNVTKWDSPGGDNIIDDGYIKAVEKVWLDDYTLTDNVTTTNNTIAIATLPTNKKITSIEVIIETSASQTNGTVSIGYSTGADVDTFLAPSTITHNLTRSSISLPGAGLLSISAGGTPTLFPAADDGFQKVTTGTQVTIAVKLNNWTMSTGTLKSIVRYT